jgi:6-phospho-beta-glucosidase
VEVSCRVDQNGITPLPIGAIPEAQLLLMQTVKYYEKMTSQAICSRSREMAVDALMHHPLVMSYPLACQLVDAYLQAHAPFVGKWH